MKKLISVAVVAAVAGFAACYLILGPCREKTEVRPPAADDYAMPATKPLFSAAVCRQSAEFLNSKIPTAPTSAERNLYAIAYATFREAELFALFESKLQEMSEENRKQVIAGEAQWQRFYQEEMFRPLQQEGSADAALESSLRSAALIFDRILYWSCSDEARMSYNALKNLSFTDRFGKEPVELTLSQGYAWNGTSRYLLLPGMTCGDAETGCGLILNGEGGRLLIFWRNGKMCKAVKVPGVMELFSLQLNENKNAVSAKYAVKGKQSSKPYIVNF